MIYELTLQGSGELSEHACFCIQFLHLHTVIQCTDTVKIIHCDACCLFFNNLEDGRCTQKN